MRPLAQALLTVAFLAVGVGAAVILIRARPEVEPAPPVVATPVVRVVDAVPRDHRVVVRAEGTVRPRTEAQLVPEVSGRVLRVAETLVEGGFFGAGDVLLEVDRRDYEAAVAQREADVARAELRLAQEEADAAVVRQEREALALDAGTPLARRELQVREARAALEAARAALDRARLDLARTRVRAPFAGRVRSERVDVGQFVTRGQAVAELYAVDAAEVTLALADEDLRHLALSLAAAEQHGPPVVLRADFAGRRGKWHGRVVRTAGEIDPRTRLVPVVVRVDDPYGLESRTGGPPLAAGLFVRAEILGGVLSSVVSVPREAVRGRDRVLAVDAEDRLRVRTVEIVRAERDAVLVSSGLLSGDRICLTPLAVPAEGQLVEPVADAAPTGTTIAPVDSDP